MVFGRRDQLEAQLAKKEAPAGVSSSSTRLGPRLKAIAGGIEPSAPRSKGQAAAASDDYAVPDEEPEFIKEEDLSSETEALWRRLQPLKATLWAAGIAGQELDTLAAMLPRVEAVMSEFMATSDPRPLTSSLVKLVTTYRPRVQGAPSTSTSRDIDPQVVLSIVLKHLALEGAMTAIIGERMARFYLDLSSRSDKLVAASLDPDAQFSMRWSRDPVDGAFAVILKAMIKSNVSLTRSTVRQLIDLSERRGRRAEKAAAELRRKEEAARVVAPIETAEPPVEVKESLQKMLDKKTSVGQLGLSFYQPYLPLIDAVLATSSTVNGVRAATWAAARTALPHALWFELQEKDISEEMYLEAAQDAGQVSLFSDSTGREMVSLSAPETLEAPAMSRKERDRQRRILRPGVWSPLMDIFRPHRGDYYRETRVIAQWLPCERLSLYQNAGNSSNLEEYLAIAEERKVILRTSDDPPCFIWNQFQRNKSLKGQRLASGEQRRETSEVAEKPLEEVGVSKGTQRQRLWRNKQYQVAKVRRAEQRAAPAPILQRRGTRDDRAQEDRGIR